MTAVAQHSTSVVDAKGGKVEMLDGTDGTVVGMWLECREGIHIFAVHSRHSERWSAKRGSDKCRLMESGRHEAPFERCLPCQHGAKGTSVRRLGD